MICSLLAQNRGVLYDRTMSDFEPPFSMSLQEIMNYASENHLDHLPLPDILGHPFDTTITPLHSSELPDYGESVIDARWLHFKNTLGEIGRNSLRATLSLNVYAPEYQVTAKIASNITTKPGSQISHYNKLLSEVPLFFANSSERLSWFQNTASVFGIKRIIADLEVGEEDQNLNVVRHVYAVERPLDRRTTSLQPGQTGTIEGIIHEYHQPEGAINPHAPTLEIAPRGQDENAPRERVTLSRQSPLMATSSHKTLFKPTDVDDLRQGDLVQVRVYEHQNQLLTTIRPGIIDEVIRRGEVPSIHIVDPAPRNDSWEESMARAINLESHLRDIRSAADGTKFRDAVGSFLMSRCNDQEAKLKITAEEFMAYNTAYQDNPNNDDAPFAASVRIADVLGVKNTYNVNLFAMNQEEVVKLARDIISGTKQSNPEPGPYMADLPAFIKKEVPEQFADMCEKTLTVMLPRLSKPGLDEMSSHDRSFVGFALSHAYLHPDQRLMTNTLLRASYTLFNPKLAAPDRYLWQPALEGIQKIITHSIASKDLYIRNDLRNFTDDNIASVIKPEAIDAFEPLLMPLLDQADKMIDALAAAYAEELSFLGDTIRKDMHGQTAQIRRTFAIAARKRIQATD